MPRRAVVVGSGCPESLAPIGPATGGPADLVVVAPGEREGGREWWAEAVGRAIEQVGDEGIVYALAGSLDRPRVAALLRRSGLKCQTFVAHRPNARTTAYLVPLGGEGAKYAFTRLDGTRSHAWAVAAGASQGSRLVLARLPSVALAAWRRGAPAPFEGVLRIDGGASSAGSWVFRRSWHPDGAAVVYRFGVSGAPDAVAKMTDPRRSLAERSALERMRADASEAGARVPRVLGAEPDSGALLLEFVHGEQAAKILRQDRDVLEGILNRIVDWLGAWNRRTLASPAGVASVQPALDAAGQIELRSTGHPGYRQWLEGLAAEHASRLPAVAAHRDLTTWNVVLDGELTGILDWEVARTDGLPLIDFFYVVADAFVAASGVSRLDAVRECFTREGRAIALARRLVHRLGVGRDLPRDAVDLCFHACWLEHAANALARDAGTADVHFVAVGDWLSRERPRVAEALFA